MFVLKREWSRGLSLIELMVVTGLLGGLLVLISGLFLSGRDAMRQSTEKLDTAVRARQLINSLAPLVLASTDGNGADAVEVFDPEPENLTNDCYFQINTREAFLDPSYSPGAPFNPLSRPDLRFRVQYLGSEQQVVLQQLTPDGSSVDLSVNSRLMGRGIAGLSLRRSEISPRTVFITVRTIADNPNDSRPGGITETILRGTLTAPGGAI